MPLITVTTGAAPTCGHRVSSPLQLPAPTLLPMTQCGYEFLKNAAPLPGGLQVKCEVYAWFVNY